MKKIFSILGVLAIFITTSAWAQPRFGGVPFEAQPSYNGQTNGLTSFNLNFTGGTPAELVKAIEKATGKPLNAIIPPDAADTQLPALKMNDVVAPQLFAALERVSQKTVAIGYVNSYSQVIETYGFKTSDDPATDSSIWYFHEDKPPVPPLNSSGSVCQFYQLQPYLERGFTVDDITTAIQTGWKMAGITSELNYHKQTTLLIAFGRPEDLATIQNVLQALPSSNVSVTKLRQMQEKVDSLEQKVDFLGKKLSTQNVHTNGLIY